MPAAALIPALAQCDFEQRSADAIAADISADQFFVDLATLKARNVVTIAADQTLTRGEILGRALSTSVTAGGGNSGNGTLTVNAIELMVVEGAYSAICTSTSSNAGIFELRRPDGSAVSGISIMNPNAYNAAVLTCVAQLEQRDIVLRGSPQLFGTAAAA
jgi:hypothetical protein